MSVRRRQAGFSLVELMVVVTITITLMAAAAPAFSNAFADRRAVAATHDVLRIGRQAYWETVAYRRAHVVWMSQMSGSNGGRVELIRGDTNTCEQPWQALRAIAGCGEIRSRCIDWVDLGDSTYTSASRGPRLRSQDGAVALAICYQPDGTTSHATSLAGRFTTGNLANGERLGGASLGGGYLLTVQSYNEDEGEATVRSVVFPLSGMPRRLR